MFRIKRMIRKTIGRWAGSYSPTSEAWDKYVSPRLSPNNLKKLSFGELASLGNVLGYRLRPEETGTIFMWRFPDGRVLLVSIHNPDNKEIGVVNSIAAII